MITILVIIMLIISIVNIGLVIRNRKAKSNLTKQIKEIEFEIILLEGKRRLRENEKRY